MFFLKWKAYKLKETEVRSQLTAAHPIRSRIQKWQEHYVTKGLKEFVEAESNT